MGRVGVTVALLNVPVHPKARRYIRDSVSAFMAGKGYLITQAEAIAPGCLQYINEAEDEGTTLCQIAALFRAGIHSIHNPCKVWVRKLV